MFNPGKKTFPWDSLRSICITVDTFIYFILSFIFKIFFNIVNASFLDNDVINHFYSNIQLLLGVFITFRLCFSLINYIINPDKVSDSKMGASNFILRIVIALGMLTLLAPLSGIPDSAAEKGSYNEAIKNKGILFGTLQIVEDKILDQNIIAALVLSNKNKETVSMGYEEQANAIISGIIKSFVWISDSSCDNDSFGDYEVNQSYNAILGYAEEEVCKNTTTYAYSYNFIGSWICGALFIFIVAGFCVDVSVRLIKLTILRLIAPIPIISYISPNSEKNGTFGSWVKMLTKTYLDLFLRIAVIYFVVYVCSTLIGNDSIIFDSDNVVLNQLSKIFIWLGLFIFAKQAPKFLSDMLGLKGDGKGFFSGIGAVAGFGALGAGVLGSIVTGWRASAEENRIAGRTNRVTNFGRNLLSAATSGVGGVVVGGRAAFTAQDHMASAIFRAQQQRNALRASHSTLTGRIYDNFVTATTGQSPAAQDQRELELNNTAASTLTKWKEAVQKEAIKNGLDGIVEYTDSNGVRRTGHFNYSRLQQALSNAVGDTFSLDGNTYNVVDFNPTVMDSLLDSQTSRYMKGLTTAGGKSYMDQIKMGGRLYSTREQTMFDSRAAGIDENIDEYERIGAAMGTAYTNSTIRSTNLRHIARRANAQANRNNNN